MSQNSTGSIPIAPTSSGQQVASTPEVDDEPPFMGAGCGLAPMPTEADRRNAWRSLFVEYAVATGLLEQSHAEELYEAGRDDWDYDLTPAQAFDEEFIYWGDDGDEP